MQLLGAALAVGAVLALYPDAREVADDLTHLGPVHPDPAVPEEAQ